MEYIQLLIRSLALGARPERHEGIDLTAASTRASFKSFRDTTSETGCPLAGEGSNLRPPDPESGVLPTELPANGFRVSQRQCPSSSGDTIARSERGVGNQERVVGATGLEPATSAVSGRRSSRLSYAPENLWLGMC